MKILLRIILLGLAGIAGIISLLIPLSAPQIAKNKLLLADMQECVRAIKAFEAKSGKPPNALDVAIIQSSSPRRAYRYTYKFGRPLEQPDRVYPNPENKGWMIWFWRGEWSEYYTSWDDYYSLESQASWWGFCGPLLLAPLISVGCLALCFLRVLRKPVPTPTPASPASLA